METTDSTFNYHITIEEIQKVLNKAKLGKAPGIDAMVYDVLKNELAAKALLKLFNWCYQARYILSVWKKAIIQPIPKCAKSDQ